MSGFRWSDAVGVVVSVALAAVMFATSGCLWVCRVPMPCHERYSDEGACTNRVWRSMVTECRVQQRACGDNGWDATNGWWCAGCYPTVKMRCVVTQKMCEPIPEWVKGERLHKARMAKTWGWFPLSLVWLASPVDAVVDTCFVPYDLCGGGIEDKE